MPIRTFIISRDANVQITEVQGLTEALNSKAAIAHSHDGISIIITLDTPILTGTIDLNNWASGIQTNIQNLLDSRSFILDEINRLTGEIQSKAAILHLHQIEEINGLRQELNQLNAGSHVHSNLNDFTFSLTPTTPQSDIVKFADWQVQLRADIDTIFGETFNFAAALTNKANIAHGHSIADINGLSDSLNPSWIPLQLQNNWVNFNSATHATAECKKYTGGLVEIKGIIRKTSGSIVPEEVVAILPPGYRPSGTIGYQGVSHNRNSRYKIEPSGVIKLVGGVATSDVGLGTVFGV